MNQETQKKKLRHKIRRIREVSDLCRNSVRVSKWARTIIEKLSLSPDFTGKEHLLDEMNKMREFMSIYTVESSGELASEVTDELLESSTKKTLVNLNKYEDFRYHITEGVFLSDIKEISLQDGDSEDLVNELVDRYLNSNDEKSKMFSDLYNNDTMDEFWDMMLGEVIDWKEFENKELVNAKFIDEVM